MERVRSTSLEKSAWPGVSIRLILTSPMRMAAFLAKTVIPRSRSSSLLSMISVPAASRVAEGLALLEQTVDERRLAVIDVGDDGDVAQAGIGARPGRGGGPGRSGRGDRGGD